MFNLFKKQQVELVEHQYKNLVIPLPANWKYELEKGDLEACFDLKSQSTLRLHVMKAVPPKDKTSEENIKSLTGNQSCTTTLKGYLLTKPTYSDTTESGINITLVTWKLINPTGDEKIIAAVTYTVLSEEKDSEQEKGMIAMIESSLNNSELG
ncbi:MAG: hypothetical protein AAB391_02260 [Patescibacteria group bacterium]